MASSERKRVVRQSAFHEDYGRKQTVVGGSERGFGIVFAVVFAIVGLFSVFMGDAAMIWALVVSPIFLGLALFSPRLLKPLNRLWFRFGLLLHAIISPVVLGALFYLSVTPMALIMRMLGKDPLRLKLDPSAQSYWLVREPPGPPPNSLKNQF